jgi:hypothetical protein
LQSNAPEAQARVKLRFGDVAQKHHKVIRE